MLWALVQFLLISRIPVRSEGISDSTGLVSGSNDESTTRRLTEIYTAIYEGAESFLRAEYTICVSIDLFSFGGVVYIKFRIVCRIDITHFFFATLNLVTSQYLGMVRPCIWYHYFHLSFMGYRMGLCPWNIHGPILYSGSLHFHP